MSRELTVGFVIPWLVYHHLAGETARTMHGHASRAVHNLPQLCVNRSPLLQPRRGALLLRR